MRKWMKYPPADRGVFGVLKCICLAALFGATQSAAQLPQDQIDQLPNIIFIFADDLGYGDISSFGAQDIQTPNIDQLAAGGIKFTDFYAAANVCSTSRASLLTGRYSVRMGISGVFMPDSPDGMPLEEITIAEWLKQAGYTTGMVGKWHLGHQDRFMPWNQGFDEFYGVPYSNDMGNFFWYENTEVDYSEIDQRYLTRRYTDKAVDFIDRQRQQPFFLYIAHSMPHVPLYVSPQFEGSSQRGLYGDVVQELDWSVGEIMAALRSRGLEENTLVVFSSDNGPWLMMGDDGGSAGVLRDGKTTTFEGGHRVPTVAYWPDGIVPRTYSRTASMLDWFPTFAALAKLSLPTDRRIDGNNLSPVLFGGAGFESPYFFFDTNNSRVDAVRLGKWKLKRGQSSPIPNWISDWLGIGQQDHPELLTDLVANPGERDVLTENNSRQLQQLRRLLAEADAIESEYSLRVMQQTKADHKGYGTVISKALVLGACLLLALFSALFVMWKIIWKVKAVIVRNYSAADRERK